MPDIGTLQRARYGYIEEQKYHRLLIDAYEGTGGFASSNFKPPTSVWGEYSAIYDRILQTTTQKLSYLDRFPREDDLKFARRQAVAHYPNYIAPLTDLKCDFILSKEFSVEDRPDALKRWRENVDGRGTTWDELLPDIVVQSATVGYIPVLVDMDPWPLDDRGQPIELSQEEANAMGLQPIVVPLLPANLLDWSVDPRGTFEWVKVRTEFIEQPDPFGVPYEVERFTIWYPDRYEKFEVYRGGDYGGQPIEVTPPGGAPHQFGQVPIAILQNKRPINDPVRGLPMHGQETMQAKRLFNAHSELDEHMRGSVFAFLVLAVEDAEQAEEIINGTANGIPLDPQSGQAHYYLSPDRSVCDAYEARIESIVREIYRQARIEFSRPDKSSQAVSGLARKFEFAQTDKALSAYAKQIARFEEHIDMLVGRGLGVPEDQLRRIKVTPPKSFDVEDLAGDLKMTLDAVTQLDIGPTAATAARLRIVQQLIPNMSEEKRDIILGELEDIANQELQQKQMDKVMAEAALNGNPNQLPANAPFG